MAQHLRKTTIARVSSTEQRNLVSSEPTEAVVPNLDQNLVETHQQYTRCVVSNQLFAVKRSVSGEDLQEGRPLRFFSKLHFGLIPREPDRASAVVASSTLLLNPQRIVGVYNTSSWKENRMA